MSHRILWSSVAALLLTGFQGWLGGRVVAHELAAWIVTVHMIVALVIVQLLVYRSCRLEPPTPALQARYPPLSPEVGLFLIVVTMIQIAIGTQVRGAVDMALDGGRASCERRGVGGDGGSPSSLCGSRGADGLVSGRALCFGPGSLNRTLYNWAFVVVGLATAQVAMGVVMAYVGLLPAAQVAHLTIASLLLGAETVLLLLGKQERTIEQGA